MCERVPSLTTNVHSVPEGHTFCSYVRLRPLHNIFCLLMTLLSLIVKCRDPLPLIRFSCGAMTDSSGLPPDRVPGEVPLLHEFKNHLSVIIGFCDLLLSELREDDPKRADVLEVRKAGHAAIALLPELSERLR